MWERAQWQWENTRAKDASKWLVKHLQERFEPGPTAFPPPLELMGEGPAKEAAIAAFTAADAVAQKKEFKKVVEAEFADLLKRLGTDAFKSRHAFTKAMAVYETALGAYNDAAGASDGSGDGAGAVAAPPAVKPTKPEYVPIDTLKWWRANRGFFKFLAPVARLLLSIQISSAEVERTIEGPGTTNQRTRASRQTVNASLGGCHHATGLPAAMATAARARAAISANSPACRSAGFASHVPPTATTASQAR